MVLEAFKVLDQRIEDCKFIYKLKSEPAGKKVKKMLVPDCLGARFSQFTCFTGTNARILTQKARAPDTPTPGCPVCSGAGAAGLAINTHKTSFEMLLRRVLRQELYTYIHTYIHMCAN